MRTCLLISALLHVLIFSLAPGIVTAPDPVAEPEVTVVENVPPEEAEEKVEEPPPPEPTPEEAKVEPTPEVEPAPEAEPTEGPEAKSEGDEKVAETKEPAPEPPKGDAEEGSEKPPEKLGNAPAPIPSGTVVNAPPLGGGNAESGSPTPQGPEATPQAAEATPPPPLAAPLPEGFVHEATAPRTEPAVGEVVAIRDRPVVEVENGHEVVNGTADPGSYDWSAYEKSLRKAIDRHLSPLLPTPIATSAVNPFVTAIIDRDGKVVRTLIKRSSTNLDVDDAVEEAFKQQMPPFPKDSPRDLIEVTYELALPRTSGT